MPIKYSHVKKRPPSSPRKTAKSPKQPPSHQHDAAFHQSPHLDRSITHAMSAVSDLQRGVARIFLLRFEQDIGRLYSTRLHNVSNLYLPKLLLACIALGSPGWVAANADSDELKDCFRTAIGMDLRQSGERVATKSVLWSYTALRHFALSNGVSICEKQGLHSLRLLPHYEALKSHVDALEAMPIATFAKPAHLAAPEGCVDTLVDEIASTCDKSGPAWDDWQMKVRVGYERMVETLWRVAKEFHIRGYGLVLREKLTTKWCDCGCSTDHLGEVCESTVREDEEDSGVRSGKEREWDGRGNGVYGWQTDEEEDLWEIDLNFSGLELDENDVVDAELTIGEAIECRYFEAERAKELGNKAFRLGDYTAAIEHYTAAHDIEPELPYYQLNIAAAHLKLENWLAAEKACNAALNQHRSSKGHWRRAKARKEMGRHSEAIKDLKALLKIQPGNTEALVELDLLLQHNHPSSSAKDTKSKHQAPESTVIPTCSSSTATGTSTGSGLLSGAGSHALNETSTGSAPSARAARVKPPRALPFIVTEQDKRKLQFVSLPLQVEMPVSGTFAEAKQRGAGKKVAETKTTLETYLYPTWDRFVVQKAPV